jgi:hypothetical protein
LSRLSIVAASVNWGTTDADDKKSAVLPTELTSRIKERFGKAEYRANQTGREENYTITSAEILVPYFKDNPRFP